MKYFLEEYVLPGIVLTLFFGAVLYGMPIVCAALDGKVCT